MSEVEMKLEELANRFGDPTARWFDQKCTFDNLYTMAEAIDISFSKPGAVFTTKDLAHSEALDQVFQRMYGKPSLKNSNAANEYDKLIGQPLVMLAHAGVLERETIKGTHSYQVRDFHTIRRISQSEKNALEFIMDYIEFKLKALNWWHHIEEYGNSAQEKADYTELKRKFLLLLIQTHKLGSRGGRNPNVEAGRIFTKALNPLAFRYGWRGSSRGHVMKTVPSKFDLVYNRPNFRDLATRKPKDKTRGEYQLSVSSTGNGPNATVLSRVMREVRNRHNYVPEVHDPLGHKATQVHHIFPKSQFPDLADCKENLICLTPGQHLNEAHPDNITSAVCPIYQKVCLYAKLESIRASVDSCDGFYSYARFAEVLEQGYGISVKEKSFAGCKLALVQVL